MRRHKARSVGDVGVLQTGVHPEDGHGRALYAPLEGRGACWSD